VAFQIGLGIVAVASRNDGWDLDCGVFKFPMTALSARSELEACFAKVFEEVADFPWHRETIPILGSVATSILRYDRTSRRIGGIGAFKGLVVGESVALDSE